MTGFFSNGKSRLSVEDVPVTIRPLVAAIQDQPDFGRRVAFLLNSMANRLRLSEAARLAVALRCLDRKDAYVWIMTERFVRAIVPSWHFELLRDQRRNEVYDQALRNAVTPLMNVLEVGTGTGILAMMAARAGAKHVYTIEIDPIIASAARSNIAENGFADKITVINKDAIDVRVGIDIPTRCDLVVHEIFADNLVGERVVSTLSHARNLLLNADALYLPQQIEVRGLLVGDERMANGETGTTCSGFRLDAFNKFAESTVANNSRKRPVLPLSDYHTLLSIDLKRDSLDSATGPLDAKTLSVAIEANESGEARQLMQWIKFKFPDGSYYENSPGTKSCWAIKHYPLPMPVPIQKGESIGLELEYDADNLFITLSSIS